MEKILISLVVGAFGAFAAIKPLEAWRLFRGRRYRNAKPSNLTLGVQRTCGILAVLMSIAVLFL